MTAANAFLHQPSSDQQGGDSRRHEPSMEDILASIRRIIADDQSHRFGAPRREPGSLASPAAQPTPLAPAAGQDDVLDLAQMRGTVPAERPANGPGPVGISGETAARGEVDTSFATPTAPEGYDDGIDTESLGDQNPYGAEPHHGAADHGHEIEASASHRTESDAPAGEALISSRPAAAVMSAFETLAATVVLQNEEMLERIMRDQLRPLIKTWLDDNLPSMVERLIRAEIERVARGGRG